jgi:hypothetical protein
MSRGNYKEAGLVANLAIQMSKHPWIVGRSIGIIAQYRCQVHLIQEWLQAAGVHQVCCCLAALRTESYQQPALQPTASGAAAR